ncbi:MAG: metalloregulator ArsR/SmtB family transcription factor [Opitutales bacterium]|nr:metalloregulator ArsR/SmtB family transcription factor [Opitutales bacterium]
MNVTPRFNRKMNEVSAERRCDLTALLEDSYLGDSNVARAAQTLTLLSNRQRLRILCHLAKEGELSVAELLERVHLSPSALSQHLARLREDDFVRTRKVRQSVYYRIVRDDIHKILEVLNELYCTAGLVESS